MANQFYRPPMPPPPPGYYPPPPPGYQPPMPPPPPIPPTEQRNTLSNEQTNDVSNRNTNAVSQDVNTRTNDAVNNDVSNRTGNTSSNQNTTGTSRQYIDVPTPQEFMDNFENAFATHVQQQVQGGGLSKQAAQWAMSHPQNFLNQYTAHLGEMAQAGQPIFRAFAPTDAPTYLGTRQGNVSSSTTQGNNQAVTVDQTHNVNTGTAIDHTVGQTQANTQDSTLGTRSGSDIVSSNPLGGPGGSPNPADDYNSYYGSGAGSGSGSGGGNGQGGPTAVANDTFSTNAGNSVANTNGRTNGTTVNNTAGNTTGTALGTSNVNTRNDASSNEQQALYSRPGTAVLHTLSPTDFLAQNAGADSLKIAYEGSKAQPYSTQSAQRASSGTRVV